MANVVIQVPTARITMGPTGFIIYAQDFLDAYKAYTPEKPFSPANYYLVCRSIELSLKSYLLLKNMPINKVKRKFGHDLHKILRKAKELGIDTVVNISTEEKNEIEKADGWYNRKGFEYFDVRNIAKNKNTLPNLEVLLDLADRLITTLNPICSSSAQRP